MTYANVVATLALVCVIGGGTAWAAAHHFTISSVGQIKPSVRRALRGHSGTNGTNGAAGAKCATGATGATGVPGIVTATASSANLSAMQQSVVAATATTPGNQIVIAQVSASKAALHEITDSIACTLINLTAALGTDIGSGVASFPDETTQPSLVDVSVQGVVAARAGDQISLSCTAGAAGFVATAASIALIPEN